MHWLVERDRCHYRDSCGDLLTIEKEPGSIPETLQLQITSRSYEKSLIIHVSVEDIDFLICAIKIVGDSVKEKGATR